MNGDGRDMESEPNIRPYAYYFFLVHMYFFAGVHTTRASGRQGH